MAQHAMLDFIPVAHPRGKMPTVMCRPVSSFGPDKATFHN
jgi:hypothetical protein